MKLHEFQTKAIFRREGIPLPASYLASSPALAKQAASEIGYPVILKAQSLVSGRGKAGGIRLIRNDEETEKAASDILSIKLRGISIQNILVEKAINVEDELFIAVLYDSGSGNPCFVLSVEGGISLEDKLPLSPLYSHVQDIDPLLGLQAFMVRQACANLRIDPAKWKVIEQIALKLWTVFDKYDATLAEINSMVFNKDGHAIVLDGKLLIDDNALYRQREFAGFLDPAITSFAQAEARKFDHKLVRLDGNIAVMSNGQGLASATVDELIRQGLKPAMVLILDPSATISSIYAACQLIQDDPFVEAILVNVFSHLKDCDFIAQGILTANQETNKTLPYVIRLKGTHCEDAKALLFNQQNISLVDDLQDAVKRTKELIEL